MKLSLALVIALSALGCGKKEEAKVDPSVLAGACDNVAKVQQCTEWYGIPNSWVAKRCGAANGGHEGGKVVASCPKDKATKKCINTSDAAHPVHNYYYEGGFSAETIADLCKGTGMSLVAP